MLKLDATGQYSDPLVLKFLFVFVWVIAWVVASADFFLHVASDLHSCFGHCPALNEMCSYWKAMHFVKPKEVH